MAIKHVTLTNYRSFGPKATRIPECDALGAINVFVGPNGSGKTALMNAIKASVERGAENSQAILWPGLDVMNARCADHHDHQTPWNIPIAFDFDDGTPSGLLQAGREEGPYASVVREYTSDSEKTSGVPEAIYNRLFPFGWPRQIVKLDAEAFRGSAVLNPEAYEAVWEKIQKDAGEYLGTALCPKSEIATPRRCTKCGALDGDQSPEKLCYRCGQKYPQGRPRPRDVGLCFLDQNNFPLLQGSDGISHFLQVIMEVRKHSWATTFLLEEPDVYMHPGMQKEFMRYVRSVSLDGPGHQFVITTHSPYIMDWTATAAREEFRDIHIYRLRYDRATGSHVTRVRPDNGWDVLEDLGHTPSDVLTARGVIWVEGPSDVHFLKVWLDLWRKEHCKPKIRWGLDCTLLTYGGSNIKYLSAERPPLEGDVAEEVAELCISMRAVAPGVVLVIDQDPGEKRGKRENKEKARTRVEASGGTVWFSDHPECWTIEDYANQDLLGKARMTPGADGKRPNSKPAVARAFEQLARQLGTLASAVNQDTDAEKRLSELSDAIG